MSDSSRHHWAATGTGKEILDRHVTLRRDVHFGKVVLMHFRFLLHLFRLSVNIIRLANPDSVWHKHRPGSLGLECSIVTKYRPPSLIRGLFRFTELSPSTQLRMAEDPLADLLGGAVPLTDGPNAARLFLRFSQDPSSKSNLDNLGKPWVHMPLRLY
jgi:hypothetical protein